MIETIETILAIQVWCYNWNHLCFQRDFLMNSCWRIHWKILPGSQTPGLPRVCKYLSSKVQEIKIILKDLPKVYHSLTNHTIIRPFAWFLKQTHFKHLPSPIPVYTVITASVDCITGDHIIFSIYSHPWRHTGFYGQWDQITTFRSLTGGINMHN